MQPKATLVLTTIFDPAVLDSYYRNFERFGRLDDVEVIVIPDRKTPKEAYTRCEELSRKGLRVTCPSLDEQETFLARVGLSAEFVPYDSDNRRNVGYLMAYERGADLLLSIDDDNHCLPEEDFVAEHAVVCAGPAEHMVIESPTGFFNLCDLLEMEGSGRIYARGFPYRFRHQQDGARTEKKRVPVHINAGLWTLDPDVDAITWLVAKPHVRGFKGESVVLGEKTWSPINTQNTGMLQQAIPAYYYVRMGYPVAGMPIDRYGDIFSGYFVQACCRHLGGFIRAGTPVAEHKRNSHNYMKDAGNEWACIVLLEDLIPWLMETRLEGRCYSEAFRSLSFALEEAAERFCGPIWSAATRGYFHQMGYCMRAWLDACARIRS